MAPEQIPRRAPPPDQSRNQRPGWRNRDILRTLALIAGFYLTLQLVWAGRSVVLLTFLGVLFGLVLGAGVDRLEQRHLPRSIGATLLIVSLLGLLGGLVAFTAPSLASQLGALRTRLPDAVTQVEQWVHDRESSVTRLLAPPPPASSARDSGARPEAARADSSDVPPSGAIRRGLVEQLGGLWGHFFNIFSSTLSVLGGILLVIFVAVFVAIDSRTYHRGLLHLFPHRMRSQASEVLTAAAATLRRWVVAQLVGMVAIGVLTTVVLLLLGVEGALALGIIAGLLEFIPIVGPILSAVPAVAMGFLDGPQMAAYVVLAYVAIQQVEANLLYPLLMKKGLEIPPVLTLVAQGVMALVFGFLGLLVAVPLLATIMVPIKTLYVRDVVGDQVTLPGQDSSGAQPEPTAEVSAAGG
jgi:predicted PurR-regulated permease PerM